MNTAEFTAETRSEVTVETAVLLGIARAAREHSPVAIGYTDRNGQSTARTVHPYGLVAHSGRWYLTGMDSNSDDLRQFRLDRITEVTTLPGTFTPPAEFEPTAHLLSALATAPYRHEVSIRVQGTLPQIRALLPAAIATVHDIDPPRPIRNPPSGNAEYRMVSKPASIENRTISRHHQAVCTCRARARVAHGEALVTQRRTRVPGSST
jgi:hypothetical protein